MAKNKKSKKRNANSINTQKSTTTENKINPFEVHLNKEKFSILGRKCKHDRGLPGVSRAKAIKKRKQTIGQEFHGLHKVNKFKDRRLGSRNINEDTATARFINEKMGQFKARKKHIFNLNDDEVLTHKGQTLEEIEQFQDPASDDSEEELDAEFTEAAHFGGDNENNDRKVAIEEKIAEAKRKKIELAKEKDKVNELTTKLDENYKQLISAMGSLKKRDEPKPKKDDYDRLLKEMIFEPRGEVTDKLKSEEELVKQEKERLEKLEKERLARMHNEEHKEEKPTHKSADDLDDGYFIGSGEEDEEEPTVAYNLNGERTDVDNDAEQENLGNEFSDDENISEESEDSDDEDEEDNLSDLKESEDEPENELNENIKAKKTVENNIQKITGMKKSVSEIIRELPYTYSAPSVYEDLFEILSHHPPDVQNVIVERIIKCNHPKLDAANRDKMVKLFGFLLQYVNDIFVSVDEKKIVNSFLILDRLTPHFFDLSHMNPEKTSQCFREVIKEKYEDYKKNQKLYPSLDFLVFFKLISVLFSTSDFRHLIVTPSYIALSHILSQATVKSRTDISLGLFIVTIILEYTELSKRILPAAINFIRGIIYLAIPKRAVEIVPIVPPFSKMGMENNLLALTEKTEKSQDGEVMLSKDLIIESIDDDAKVRILNTAFKLLNEYLSILKDNVGVWYLAEPFIDLMKRIDLDNYPDFVKSSFDSLSITLDDVSNKSLKYLIAAEKKPKALKLMEPRIEKVYNDKRRPKMSKEKEMRAILVHKVKRETKGVMRELRRDNAFLAKLQIKKQIQSDTERKEKVRKIFAEASVQQGELNAFERKRKR